MEELFNLLMENRLAGLSTAIPAKVLKYYSSNQSVDVQPAIKSNYIDDREERVVESIPVINRVPVVFPGSGGYRVTFPVAAGDTVLLVFSQASIDRWLSTSVVGGVIDPGNYDMHDVSDAIAIPGLRQFTNSLGSAPTDSMSVGKDGGPTIEITGSEIQCGGTGALVTKTEFDDHVHTSAGSGSPSSTPTVPITGTTILKGA